MTGDWVGVIEAAYAPATSDARWLRRVHDAVAPLLDRGLGVAVELFDLDASVPVPGGYRLGVPLHVTADRSSPASRLARMLTRFVPAEVLSVYAAPQLASTAIGRLSAAFPGARAAWEAVARPFGVADMTGISAAGADRRGVLLSAPRARVSPLTAAATDRWVRMAMHLGAGLRLRRASAAHPDAADAVLRPDGALDHATGEARDASLREALRRAAIDVDRARGRLRRRDPERAVELWRALVEGRWSLVDFFDTDGRRYVLARRNPTTWPAPRALTPRERQAAISAATGASNKLIAYELGVTTSSAAGLLTSALRKLGLRRRAQLLPIVRALLG